MYGKNRSVMISIKKSAKMFPSRSAKLSMKRGVRRDTDSSVTSTITKSIPSKMRRIIWTGYKKKYSKTQEQDCGTIQNQLETMNGKLCHVVLWSECYDNPKKEYKSMQKSVKKITH